MSGRQRPDPPAASGLSPTVEIWQAGVPLVRLFQRRFGPRGFNPTEAPGRFRPVRTGGEVVPTAYAAGDEETALAEVLLRGVDALSEGLKPRLYRHEVEGVEMVRLVPQRELRLARLHGQGLTRLGILRKELIDVGPSDYPYTASWAQALYECALALDGLVWTSHQNDSGRALMLWEGSS